ncbi:hypothetical protein [Ramlibacter tataouinensis]|uniref:Uncharacterized protein n=1 Tax=Ramlibacter tataouinensis (strain ATCC BAA-407 / DSM 14655 / LMG 21543 / TTB310) TaxID=365046 RepID=F5Y380_RAMTT|nr:hypothetical protein [Ramlibacter tataouinensis]AEG91167.1 Hypothetical protein Rta_01060 [Ramlibacter tataouinensis TTB310]
MSKRTRHADNSKRQQPIQQQRAQAAASQAGASKQAKTEARGRSTQGAQGGATNQDER